MESLLRCLASSLVILAVSSCGTGTEPSGLADTAEALDDIQWPPEESVPGPSDSMDSDGEATTSDVGRRGLPSDGRSPADPCDLDMDGFIGEQCSGSDCDDTNAAIHPLATEVCRNKVDEDCSGVLDDRDLDKDGAIAFSCGGDDCHDGDAGIAPHLIEQCNNTVDEDCSGGIDDRDLDKDGFRPFECGGEDCDDTNPLVHPLAVDYVVGHCTAPQSWTLNTAIQGTTAFASMAVDSEQRLHIAYQGNDYRLHYVTEGPDGFESELVDPAPDTGSNVSIALQEDKVHVSYLDLEHGRLKYATNTPGYWGVSIVEQGFVGWFSSIAVRGAAVAIAYQDVEEKDLHYAHCQGSCHLWTEWTATTVLAEGEVGKFSSLALSDAGRPFIAHRDDTNDSLLLTSQPLVGGEWLSETVDKSPGVGWAPSLLRNGEETHVSYFDQQKGTLKLASRLVGGWTVQTVASVELGMYQGQSTALTLDAMNRPHIGFSDDTDHGLKYAYCKQLCGIVCCEESWAIAGVDALAAKGASVSLVITEEGAVQLAYTGGKAPFAALRVATAPCVESMLDDNCDGVDGVDQDGDGFSSQSTGGTDCSDELSSIHPGAPDPPMDGIDWNCDTLD